MAGVQDEVVGKVRLRGGGSLGGVRGAVAG
jgi:hypothetical protein